MATELPAAAALVPAAGHGERLGLGPKALLDLNGSSLLRTAADTLLKVASQLVIAAPAGLEGRFRSEVPAAEVVTGGATRQETVHLLLAAARHDLVLIHDAARPFLPEQVARAALLAAASEGAVTAAVPVADTLLRSADGQTVDRTGLLAVQTPQAFSRNVLLEAHEQAARSGWSATDDAALVRRLGHVTATVPGSPWLFKITHPADLQFARALAGAWQETLRRDDD